MNRVNKIDFYCGAFLSYLISNGIEPTLFESTEKAKIIEFTLRNQEYNAYIKYVGNCRTATVRGKSFNSWDTAFTLDEKAFLKDTFIQKGKENIVIIVCTTKDFDYTEFAVIPFEDAIACLGEDTINKRLRIVIKRQKHSKNLWYYGTTIVDTKAKRLMSCDDYFHFSEKPLDAAAVLV